MLSMHIRSCFPRFLYLLGILLVSFKLIVINHKAEILKEIVNNPFTVVERHYINRAGRDFKEPPKDVFCASAAA